MDNAKNRHVHVDGLLLYAIFLALQYPKDEKPVIFEFFYLLRKAESYLDPICTGHIRTDLAPILCFLQERANQFHIFGRGHSDYQNAPKGFFGFCPRWSCRRPL